MQIYIILILTQDKLFILCDTCKFTQITEYFTKRHL